MALMIAPFAVLIFSGRLISVSISKDVRWDFAGRRSWCRCSFDRCHASLGEFAYRVVTGEPLQPRRDLGMFLNQWVSACGRNGTVRPVIVAIWWRITRRHLGRPHPRRS
jgi:hypothetical protein